MTSITISSAEELIKILEKNSVISNASISSDIFLLDDIRLSKKLSTDVVFENCKFLKSFWLNNLVINDRFGLNFHNCQFEGELRIRNQNSRHLNFISCSFTLACDIADSNINTLKFDSCYSNIITLIRIKAKFIGLHENDIVGLNLWSIDALRVSIDNIEKKKITRIDLGHNLDLRNLDIKSNNNIDIIDLDNIGTARFYGTFNKIYLFAENFKLIEFGHILERNPVFSTANEIIYSHRVFSGHLIFQNINIKHLAFRNISNNSGEVRFDNINIENTSLVSVSIDSFYWNHVQFQKELKIVGCNLKGLIPVNVFWLQDKSLTPNILNDKKFNDLVEIMNQRDTYRQLKSAYQNINNKIESLSFYRNEMILYWKEFRISKVENREYRFLIRMNKWVSDFNQSFLRPFFFLLFFHFLFCSFIWYIESYTTCGVGTNCSNDFLKGLAQFSTWLNPVFDSPENWSDASVSLSIIMRISNSFFIFHFLKALRKFA